LLGDVGALVRAADQAAYAAKGLGGNRVVAGGSPDDDEAHASAVRA
jgi:hypothetical protein